MEPRALDALFMQIAEIKVDMNEMAKIEVQEAIKPVVNGDTAVIAIKGILMKKVPFIFHLFGIETTSYTDIQGQISYALADNKVKKILLDIDSPGGVVAGVMETGNAIAAAGQMKKTTAQIEDLGASGAYWLASQASKITATPNTEVGSIGVYAVYVDYSKRAEEDGIQVHVVKSGEHKGMGVMGAKISDEQLAAVQEIVNGLSDNFIKAVSTGRGLSTAAVRELSDGRLWLAEKARTNGLIDSVINKNLKQTNNPKNKKGTIMETSKGKGFIETAKLIAAERRISMTEAMKKLRWEQPQLYEDYLNNLVPTCV